MLIILTIIGTWIVKNWWKLLLLLIGVIALREYQVYKHKDDKKDDEEVKLIEGGSDGSGADDGE